VGGRSLGLLSQFWRQSCTIENRFAQLAGGHRKPLATGIVVYGALAKGSTLLNYFGLGQETIDYVVDAQRGQTRALYPGTHLQIVPPERLLADQPDYVLLLTWNFAAEILEQQAEYRRRGGRFILPIRHVESCVVPMSLYRRRFGWGLDDRRKAARQPHGFLARTYSVDTLAAHGLCTGDDGNV
jgi:hypothetical protein